MRESANNNSDNNDDDYEACVSRVSSVSVCRTFGTLFAPAIAVSVLSVHWATGDRGNETAFREETSAPLHRCRRRRHPSAHTHTRFHSLVLWRRAHTPVLCVAAPPGCDYASEFACTLRARACTQSIFMQRQQQQQQQASCSR